MSDLLGAFLTFATLVVYGVVFWLAWTLVDAVKGIRSELRQIRRALKADAGVERSERP